MPNGYDFSDDESVLEEQREYAKNADKWDNLDEKAMGSELGTLNSRMSACVLQLSRMIAENDYTKTKDMLDELRTKDLGSEGWLSTFYNTNKDAFLKYLSGDAHPEWYDALKPEMKKTYDAGKKYYRDVKYLVNVGNSVNTLLQSLRLAEGFKLMRVKENFESAGFSADLYNKVNTDVKRVSDFLHRDWGELERNAHSAKRFLEENLSRLPKGELEKGYRATRLSDFQGLVYSSGLLDSFTERSDGNYGVLPDLLTKASVIDRYTYLVAQTDELKEPMQKTIDACKTILAKDFAEADKNCATQAAQFLCAAFQGLIEAVSRFAELSLETYQDFREAKDKAPYCFMRKLSALSAANPIYDFRPNTSEPWDSGTYYKDLYTEAAKALGTQARLFVYDHGATIA